jgi:hypothetical protein
MIYGMDTPSFETALESDMQQLAAEIRGQRERPEMKDAAEQELVREAIRAFPESAESKNQPQAAAQSADAGQQAGAASAGGDNPASPLPAYAQHAPAEVKLEIEYLLDIALKKGIGPALAESQKSPAFVQDAFHDALAGRLYPELQKRGVVR